MYNFKFDQLLKMEAHPWDENYNVKHHKHHRRDTPPSQLQYSRKEGVRSILQEKVLKLILLIKTVEIKKFDCRSDVEYVPDSENKSESEESDLDDSLALPSTSYSLNKEKVSETLAGNVYHFYKWIVFCF